MDNSLSSSDASSDEKSKEAVNVVKWIFDNTRAKFVEVFEQITRLVNELFGQPPKKEGTTKEGATDQFEEKLRTSFLLSVVVLLVVVVTRANAA